MTQKYITNIHFKLKKYQIKPTILQLFSPNKPASIALYSQICIPQIRFYLSVSLIYQHIMSFLLFFDEEEY